MFRSPLSFVGCRIFVAVVSVHSAIAGLGPDCIEAGDGPAMSESKGTGHEVSAVS